MCDVNGKLVWKGVCFLWCTNTLHREWYKGVCLAVYDSGNQRTYCKYIYRVYYSDSSLYIAVWAALVQLFVYKIIAKVQCGHNIIKNFLSLILVRYYLVFILK